MMLERRLDSMTSEILGIVTSRHRDEYIIELAGELDLSGVTCAADAFERALASDASAIVLDLRDLEFLDSTGVHAILKFERSASERKRSFVIVRGPRQVQQIFEISGIADRLVFSDG
jgi:anti-sigma B factor antagonist